MGSVLIQLLPLVIGSIVMPSWVLLVLALLSKGRGQVGAIALVVGITSARLLQGIIFGSVLSAYELSHNLRALKDVASILLIIFGILLWATALSQVFRQYDPKLMSMVGAVTPVKALGLGALLVVTSSRAWIFTLAALGILGQAGLTIAQSALAFLLYLLGSQILLVAPILMSARSPARFEAAARWLEEYTRPLVVVVSFAVGCFFLWRGLSGLRS